MLDEHRRARAMAARIVSPPHERVAVGTVLDRHRRYVLVAAGASPPRAG